jgi:hypothetical protein
MRLPFVLLTAVVRCAHHTGLVTLTARQTYVTVQGTPILIEGDPVGLSIVGCNNVNVFQGLLPCLKTLQIEEGYSSLLRIDGRAVCLQNLRGKTTGTPVGQQDHWVRNPGQSLVAEVS